MHEPYLSIELELIRPQMDNTHAEHNQKSTEDTKHAENKPSQL